MSRRIPPSSNNNDDDEEHKKKKDWIRFNGCVCIGPLSVCFDTQEKFKGQGGKGGGRWLLYIYFFFICGSLMGRWEDIVDWLRELIDWDEKRREEKFLGLDW